MIRLLSGESIVVDAGSNTDLRVCCKYISGSKRESYGSKLNSTSETVAKGPATIEYLSVFNNDGSAQITTVALVVNGTDCYVYNGSLGSKKAVILVGDNYQET